MRNIKRTAILIILPFIVSIMLIGIFTACIDVDKQTSAETVVEQSSQNIETNCGSELDDNTAESDGAESIKLKTSSSLLTDDEAREIVWAYIKDDHPNFDLTYSVKCFGKVNGAYAVFVDSNGWGFFPVQTTEVVNGVTFVYPDSRTLEIYCDGEIYSLSEAFNKKIISAEFVYDLSLMINGLYSKKEEN